MSVISPLAAVHPDARIGDDVEIGPFCSVGPNVSLGDGTRLVSHVSLSGHTSIGPGCTLYPFVTVGHPPQDTKHDGSEVRVIMGARNVLREKVNIHPGSSAGRRNTVIGDDCLFMVGAHIAHECIVGSHVVLTNSVALGGAVEVGDYATLGGLSAVVQFTRIGKHAFVGGKTLVTRDLIPYGYALGAPANLVGLNNVGLKRRGFSKADIRTLRKAYGLLFATEGTFADRLEDAADSYRDSPLVDDIVQFIRTREHRDLLQPDNWS